MTLNSKEITVTTGRLKEQEKETEGLTERAARRRELMAPNSPSTSCKKHMTNTETSINVTLQKTGFNIPTVYIYIELYFSQVQTNCSAK